MYFSGLGTATPTTLYTKAECLAAFQDSDWYGRLDARSHLIARTVLQRDNGIETRHLALDSLADSFTIDPDTLAQRFLLNAPALATTAAERALACSGTECGADRRRHRQHVHRLPLSGPLRLCDRAPGSARGRAGL